MIFFVRRLDERGRRSREGEATNMRILDVTGVTKRFQTTVPKLVREVLNLSNTDRIVWILDDGEIKVKKA